MPTHTNTRTYMYMCICNLSFYIGMQYLKILKIYRKLKDSLSIFSLKINYLFYMQSKINTLKHAFSL